MEFEKLKKNDLLFISISFVIFLISLIFSLKTHKIAFPGQSITFELSREEALQKADSLMTHLGIHPVRFQHHAITFSYPEKTKIFIEKELGIKKSHTFFSKTFNIWQWSVRFFNDLEKEEVFINYTTSKELRYFEHTLPEEQAVNSVSDERAEQLARNFIASYTLNDLEKWQLKDKSTESKKARVDYSFTFKKNNVEIYGAHFEIEIVIKGNKVGHYREYLKLPEFWERNYQKLRSQNEITSLIAMVGLILLGISSAGFFIFFAIKHQINLKTGIIFGTITFSIYMISQLNTLPLSLYWYSTEKSLSNFYTDILISDIFSALLYSIAVFFLASSGDALYHSVFPQKISLLSSFSRQGMKTKEFFFGSVTGFTAAFLFIAFQIIFYWLAEKFGAWSPAQVTYSEILNTRFPWIYILFAGFIPAVTEEFCFRFYGIPLFKKFTHSKVFAILITALVWGFAHSNYPNQPFWIRGLEVSLFGIATGYILIRFGIAATLIWHYTVDAFLTFLMFCKTGKTSIILSSAIAASIALFFIIYTLFFYFKNKGFLIKPHIEGPKQETPENFETEELLETIPHVSNAVPPYSKHQVFMTLLITLVFFSALFIPLKKPGNYIKYQVPEQDVLATAKAFLNHQGFDPERFRTSMDIITDCNSNCLKYIIDHTSIDSANFIASNYLPNLVSYKVRFFNENEKEEFHVYVHPMDNEVTGFNHVLEETAMSYNLPQELALIRVEQFIAEQDFDLADFDRVESYSETLPHRTDHTYIYESKPGYAANIADGRLRVSITVKGDELGSFQRWYKIPEKWEIDQNKESNLDSIRKILQFFLLPVLFLLLLLKYKHHFNFNCIPWKVLIIITSGLFIILFASNLLNIKHQMIYYNTTWSIKNFILSVILSNLLTAFFNSLLLFLILLLGFAFYGSNDIIKDLKQSQSSGFDILLSSLVSALGLIAIFVLQAYFKGIFPQTMAQPTLFIPDFLVEDFFLLKILIKIFLFSILAAILTYTFGSIIFENKILLGSTFLIVLAALPIKIDTMPEFLFNYLSIVIVILWMYFCHRFWLQKNLLAYLMTGACFFTIFTGQSMISTGSTKAVVGGYFLIGLFSLLIVWLLIKDRTNWYERILK
ncbi:MAG: CPBP family intramembrane metalloprotease [Candidatus Marinimicrobia bacterium]|nr:CPBP family intramembrane metalloprotease [Candidatus Neomarinimicrobiota bacterium]